MYGKRKFLWTLMRHFLALPLLASRVRESAVTARLVLPARMPQRLGPRCPTTASRAVPIAAIASRADEKTLLTFEPATDNESKRVHVPGGRLRKTGHAHAAVPRHYRRTRPRGSTRGTRRYELRVPHFPRVSRSSLSHSAQLRQFSSPMTSAIPGNPSLNHRCPQGVIDT